MQHIILHGSEGFDVHSVFILLGVLVGVGLLAWGIWALIRKRFSAE